MDKLDLFLKDLRGQSYKNGPASLSFGVTLSSAADLWCVSANWPMQTENNMAKQRAKLTDEISALKLVCSCYLNYILQGTNMISKYSKVLQIFRDAS
jgi:hypothetical protein